MHLKLGKAAFCLLTTLIFGHVVPVSAQTVSAQAYINHQVIIPTPPGNRNETMPRLPQATVDRRLGIKRVAGQNIPYKTARSFDAEFANALTLLSSKQSRDMIFQVASQYSIDPILIVAAIVGEGTFNVGFGDTLQGYSIRAGMKAGKWLLAFQANKVDLSTVVNSEEMAPCRELNVDYDRWECIRVTWDKKFRNKMFNNVKMPNDRLREAFFNPLGSGYSYGPGQLEPLRALMFSDVVNQVGGAPVLSVDDPVGIYQAILDPNISLQYVAASIKKTIEVYKSIAGFDISQNAGVIATLYNLGFEIQHATELYEKNQRALSRGGQLTYPQESYYGWAINARLDDLRLLLAGKWKGQTVTSISLDAEADATIARYKDAPADMVNNTNIGTASSDGGFFFNLLNPNRR